MPLETPTLTIHDYLQMHSYLKDIDHPSEAIKSAIGKLEAMIEQTFTDIHNNIVIPKTN